MSRYTDSYGFKDMQERFGVTVTSKRHLRERRREGARRCWPQASSRTSATGGAIPVEFYQDGVARSIPKAWIREYAPNIAKLYDDYPLAWNTWENPDNPEELLAINGISAKHGRQPDPAVLPLRLRHRGRAGVARL